MTSSQLMIVTGFKTKSSLNNKIREMFKEKIDDCILKSFVDKRGYVIDYFLPELESIMFVAKHDINKLEELTQFWIDSKNKAQEKIDNQGSGRSAEEIMKYLDNHFGTNDYSNLNKPAPLAIQQPPEDPTDKAERLKALKDRGLIDKTDVIKIMFPELSQPKQETKRQDPNPVIYGKQAEHEAILNYLHTAIGKQTLVTIQRNARRRKVNPFEIYIKRGEARAKVAEGVNELYAKGVLQFSRAKGYTVTSK